MPDKVALITAASRGMGAAIAQELAAGGYRVALLATSDAVHELAASLNGIAVQGSVTNPDDLKRFVDTALSHYGRVDAVVNNTGHPPKGDLLTIPDEAWLLGADLLLLNVVRMARLVTPTMQAQGSGAFVNISTYFAFEPNLTYPVSSTFRAALGSFAKMYADRYAKDNIRMNNILPGFIDSYEQSAETIAKVPMQRYGTVGEIAKTTAFLLSDGAGYITGQNIRVDGGMSKSV
jgi:NAD(P)-dependent dehydrogenase (short-subunit alcohol dehydrogenase family)